VHISSLCWSKQCLSGPNSFPFPLARIPRGRDERQLLITFPGPSRVDVPTLIKTLTGHGSGILGKSLFHLGQA
jgi:hypothetical protein